jgi:beta-glucanase (GH16 family)
MFSKKIRIFYYSFILFTFFISSCSGSSSGNSAAPESNTPTNITISHIIVGSSSTLPNGDGTGVVNFSVTANKANSYKLLIGNETLTSSTGTFTYIFKELGTNSYTVYVSAYNGTNFVSTSENISVYVAPKLAWSDEFNTDGAPDSSKWGYDLGAGGWGNHEVENYTNRPENINISNGTLKINLLKEDYQGSSYTSARILTKGKYSFKYGRIDIRAKLPSGGGTWPALWSLGDDIDTTPWPGCGEMDFMEHVGNQQNKIFSTLHYPGHSGANGTGGTTVNPTVSTEFHVYSTEWTSATIKFYIDNQLYYTFNNDATLPFNKNFFLILNVAMGGDFGGAVDPSITKATMEVDYVRVYQ